jgi:Ni/Co efflux regulator RcnB
VKSLMCVVLAGVLLGGAAFVAPAEAGDHGRKECKRDRRARDRHDRHDRRYFRDRDVVVIRDHYRPYYRPLPHGLRHRYVRSGYLPPGWHRRIRPVPVYVERDLVILPRGYHRGIIDGHAVVYNSRGLIIDVAVLF